MDAYAGRAVTTALHPPRHIRRNFISSHFFFRFFALRLVFFFTLLAFGQPVTLIFVDWWITAPFCATNSVGIFNPPLTVHKFAFAVSAEYFPWGSVSSNVLTGASGTVLNVLLVIPALLMNVVADQINRDAVALQHDDQARERFAAVADEVRRAFQRDRQNRCDRLGIGNYRR